MALIDFKCENCNESFFEIIGSAEGKIICPNCGSEKVRRVYKGKYYGKSASCSGNCSSCGGCNR